MKKYITLIITTLILIFTLSSCDTEDIVNNHHDFHIAYDEHNHFEECDCGEKQNEEAHIFSDAIHVISYPTCTTEGVEEYHCIVCDYKEQRKTKALGHTFGDWETIQSSTCISKGQAKRVCTVCGAEEFKELDLVSHIPTPYTDVAASCTHEGHVGGSYCSVCKEELEPYTITSKIPHTFTEWETIQTPDCIHKGQAKRVCTICNYEEYKELDYTDHTPVNYDDKASSCTEEGHTGGTYCSVCHEELTPVTITPKTAHYFGDWQTTIEATCQHVGSQKRVCQDCGHEETQEIPILNHTIVANDEIPATCTHTGLTGGTHCSECGTEITPSIIVDKLSHDYGDWTTTIEADCTHKGQEKHVCHECGDTEYRDIDIKPHTSTPYEDLEADCTHEGHIGGTYCSVCHAELTPYTVVAKTAHTYGEWETIQNPTCISQGQAKRVCSVCGYEDYKYLDMIEHTPVPGTAVSSTCISHGHTEGLYCSYCHTELEAPTELPFGDHNYSIETTTKEATINSDGILTHTCSVCGDSYTTPKARKSLTQLIWINSFKVADFKNHFVEYYYVDHTLNKTYDVLVENYNNIKHVRIYDHDTNKYYEYYYDGHEIIESCVDGYRHKAFVDMPDVDMYLEWFDSVLYNGIYYASFAYDKVEFKTDNGGYFIGNGIEAKNYKGNTETATVGISFSDDEKLTGFTYSSDKYDICIFEIGNSSSIPVPTATHHHVVDGKCDVCNTEYDTYSITKNNMKLNYYVNKSTNELEFDYSLLYANTPDVTFLMPTYYKDVNLRRFTTLYYEGTSPYVSKEVKSMEYKLSNSLLKITYKDYSVERLILLNDNTCISVSSDTATAAGTYNGLPYGQYFDLKVEDKTIRYYLKSDTELEITEYTEINYYNYNDYNFTDFNSRKLESVLDRTFSSYSDGKKHDGTQGYIYFKLSNSFKLEIDYEHIPGAPFSAIKFLNITGYYTNKSDFRIYFMADNENYVLHYDGNVTISKI